MSNEIRDYDEQLDGDGLLRQVSMYSLPPKGVKVLLHRVYSPINPIMITRQCNISSRWSGGDFDKFTGWTFVPEKPEPKKVYANDLDDYGNFVWEGGSLIRPSFVKFNEPLVRNLIDFLKDNLDGN